LEVLATVFQTGHSFWMYSLHHAGRYEGKSRPRAGAWFDPMKSLVGLAGLRLSTCFADFSVQKLQRCS
jgi:hypothetical protein